MKERNEKKNKKKASQGVLVKSQFKAKKLKKNGKRTKKVVPQEDSSFEVESELIELEEEPQVEEVDLEFSLVEPEPEELVVEAREKPKKVPKIRRSAANENVEDNFIIVPWASREEWEVVCGLIHDGCFKEAIGKIGVWQKRVPKLPVGVEASLFLLEAIIYDEIFAKRANEERGQYTEDQARSLYSLAIIRYLNHVSHLATHSLGESSTRLTRDLAAIVDTPEWLVSLRNEVSHGASAPSIEILRMGGSFILQWLKEKYWVVAGKGALANPQNIFTVMADPNENDAQFEITQLLAAYIAARIYKMRGLHAISDPEIIRHVPTYSSPVKTKVAVIFLRNSLNRYLESHPSLFCIVVTQELIPSLEFYEDFVSILNTEENEDVDGYVFDKLYGVWMPIIRLLGSKGKFISVLGNLCDLIVNPECERMWSLTARWIDKFLELIETSGKKYAKHLCKFLEIVIKHPNSSMHLFLQRLFRLTQPRLGSETICKLEVLTSIWIDDIAETKKRKRNYVTKMFTLNDLTKGTLMEVDVPETDFPNSNSNAIIKWTLDERGEGFWRSVPLGAVL